MKRIGLFLLLAIAANASAATLTLGNVQGNPGQTVTISVALQNQGTPVLSGIQFDLLYDTTAMTITAVESDAAFAKPQRKTASTAPLAAGDGLRVLLSGGQAVMPDENVVDLTIVIGAAAPTANYRLAFTGVLGSDSTGNLVSVSGISGNLTVGNPPSLSVAKHHTGNLAQGQANATYSVSVSNLAGAASTSGAVTLTENIPTGLTLLSMAGNNWDCTAGTSCTRSDALAGGASYDTVSVSVSVANNAAASITNQVTVTGGGSLSATASDATTIIVPQSQTITFGQLSAVTLGVSPFTVSATATSLLPVTFASTTTSVCTVSVGGTVAVAAAGTCTIVASQTGNGTFAPAASVPQSFTVNPANQTITFTQPADRALNAGPVALTATASSTLSVSFSSNTTAVCTVTGSSVTLVTKGSCSITASQAGNGNYNSATATKIFNVLGNSNVITFPQPADTGLFSGPIALTATANSALAVSYSSNSTAVCTVAGSSVTLVSVGACSITANQAGDPNFAAAVAVTDTFNVVKGSQTITFAPLSGVVFGAASFTVSPTASSTLAVTLASTTLPVCTVSGFTVTIAGAGSCSLTASQSGDGRYAAATSVIQAFTVAQASQTITFNALNSVPFGTASFAVSATASSALGVTFASATQSVCTVAVSTVTLAGVGTCTITASQGGNTNYSPATSVPQSFAVTLGTQTINFPQPAGVAVGVSPFVLSATASSGLPVSFASTTSSVCTVSVATVTIATTGTCTIQASQGGSPNYGAAPVVTQSFTVAAAGQTITFAPLNDLTFGAASFTVTATASSSLVVGFTSTTQLVCTVSNTTVAIIGAGSCSIKADQAGNANFGAATSVTRTFNVAKASQSITFNALANTTFGSAAFAVSATASSTLPVTVTSNTTSICTVSGSTVTLAGVGSCSITVSQAGNGNYNAATSVTQNFNIGVGSQTITFAPLSNVAFGSAPITLSATASSTLAVSFASTTPLVCTVSNTTTLTLVAPGSCTVTASQAGNGNYAAAPSVPQSFSVAAGSQTITFAPLSNSTVGVTPFTVSATASSTLAVVFTSGTTSVCTVTNGAVTTIAIGTCTILANQAGNANFAAATQVSQSFTVGQGAQTITFGPLSGIALGIVPPALHATASSGLVVSFTTTTTSSCTVAGTTISLVDVGTCSITASQVGDTNYTAATPVIQSFTVAPGTQTITFAAPATVALGVAPFTVVASTTSNLPLTFTSTTLSVCTLSGSTATILTAGTCTITVSQAGNTSFAAAVSVSQNFTVSKGPQTITFATPADVIMGVSPFAITATSSSGLTVAFASTTTAVCTLSSTTVTVVGAGSCSISATQPGDANYLAAPTVSRNFTVTPGPQTITFAPLNNVAFGVSPISLAATSSAGLVVSFSSSTLGVCTVSSTTLTVVGPGNCSVTASQSGNANYSAASSVTRVFIATGTQAITFPTISNQALGTPPFELGGTATSGLAVAYTSTTLPVCTVSGDTVTLLTPGTCSITANQQGNSVFLAGSAVSQSFTVLPTPTCQYDLNPDSASITTTGGSGVLKIQTGTGCAWNAISNANFITLTSAATGTDTSSIGYAVAANTGSARTGTITVSGQTFTVNQFGASCSFALSDSSLDFGAAGGSAVVSIFAPIANCSWSATPNDQAVTLSSANGIAPSQVTVSIAANTTASTRTVTATIGGQTLTLNEQGNNCSVTLGAAAATLPAAGGPGSVTVTTQSGCSYSTVTGPSWISVTSGGSGTGPGGTLFYSVDANSTTASRTGAMSIGGQSFQITQPGVSCEISLDTSNLGSPFSSTGGAGLGTIGISTSNAACNWTASTHASWLSFNGPNSGTGAGAVSISATGNGASTSRSAIISIEGQSVSVSQAGTTCAYSLRSSTGGVQAAGGSGSVGVVSAPGCAWTATANDSWLHTSASGTGTGDAQFTIDANATAAGRTGTLTVAGQTYTVNEGGLPCTFSLALASVNVGVSGVSNATVGFSAGASNCTATAVSFSNWLTVSTSLTGQSGTITYNAAINNGPARLGVVKLGDQTFSVIQAASACTFILATPGAIVSKAGGPGSIPITASGGGCTPSALSNQPWVTTGIQTGPVSSVFTQPFTVAPFSSASTTVRTARITLGGKTFTIKQTSW